MKKANAGFSTKVDLIELSDAFRRHAKFDNPRVVKGLVDHSRVLLCLLSQYRPEEENLPENKEIAKALQRRLLFMSGLAIAVDVDEIVLPVADSRMSAFSSFFKTQVLKGVASVAPVKLSMQKDVYEDDLSSIGPVDRKVRTVLDTGLRGFMKLPPARGRHVA